MQKKSKNFQFLKKFFFARNNLKCLKICWQHHSCSPRQISGRYFLEKKLVIFQEICDPGYAKKVKKLQIFENFFFRSKRAKTPYNSFATPFVQSTTNFRLVFRKKVVSHFSRNLWPRICKKSQKIGNLGKFFFARNDLKHLKIRLQHHLCSPRQISGRYLSKKKLVIFQEICDPGYAKKVKKLATFEKFFFARNDLKRLKILSQHHSCSPRKISGPYLSKKKLVIFQEICDPGYAKKVKKLATFEKIFFRLKQPKTPWNSFATPFVQSTTNFRSVSLEKRSWSFFKKSVTPNMQKVKKFQIFEKFFFRSQQP